MLLKTLVTYFTFVSGVISAAVQRSSPEQLPGCGELDMIVTYALGFTPEYRWKRLIGPPEVYHHITSL